LIGAWYGAEIFALRSIRTLLGVARHVQAGRLGARTGLTHGKDELAQLGAAFDNMAAALQARDGELQRALHELQQQAITDVLTGLYNRRFLYEVLPRELARGRRSNTPVAVVMMDIDHFKRVNDTCGHEAGDRVLKAIARVTEATVRASDVCCRYGGEEFCVVLPESPPEGARERAEAIRAAVEQLEVEGPDGKRLKVTVSLGIAVCPGHGADVDSLLRAADEALYDAKAAGRNRVVMHTARQET
jgi:diguanylate cyclase (GGDEF)-like protein